MKRRVVWVGVVALVFACAAVNAQELLPLQRVSSSGPCLETEPVASGFGEPFGNFEGIFQGGTFVASGQVVLVGWALDDDGVAAVDIQVDGVLVGRATYGETRADVARMFAGFPDAVRSGWRYQLDTTRWPNGSHIVEAVVTSISGEVSTLNPLGLEFTNTSHNLRPFGVIDHPRQNAELYGVCDPSVADRRYSVVTGWVLDAGIETNDHGVGYVELLVDGSLVANSRRDCFHSTTAGPFTNCYGLRRQDVQRAFPTLKNAPNAGFRFVLDVGAMIDFGYSVGHHVLTIRAGDVDSQVANVDSIDVFFGCDDFFANEKAFGGIDNVDERVLADSVEISGWALDAEGVSVVEIHVDGTRQGDAVYGFPRPEISSLYPGFINSATPGWFYTLDTTPLADGEHEVQVFVRDALGSLTTIGEVRFSTVDN